MPDSKTTERELYLLSLKPSSNLEAELWNVKRKIFKEAGFLSALALPPIIPLCWNHNPFSAEKFLKIRNRGLPPLLYRGYSKSGNIITGILEPAEPIENLVKTPSTDGPLDTGPGVFLAVDEEGKNSSRFEDLILNPETRYTGFILLLMRMRIDPARSDWWERLRWECLMAGKIKKVIPSPEGEPG